MTASADRPTPFEGEPGAAWFVWGAWLVMTVLAVGFVARFGPEVPLYDDYAIIPALVGDEAVTPGYLWSLHFEHRVPLPRVVLLIAYPASGSDFRAGMFATVACLSILASGVLGALRVRGGWNYADALVPILLLNWGHHNNLLWSWQIAFGLSTLLAVGLAGVLVGGHGRVGGKGLAGLGMMLVLLPLCAASGLVMVPPVAAWLIGLGVLRLRANVPGGWAAIGAAVPGVIVTLLYFVGYEKPPQIDKAPGLGAVVRTGLQFMAIGFGPVAGRAWSVGGLVAIGLMVSALGLLISRAWTDREERGRALGLLAVMVGFAILAASLAWGRSGTNDRGGLEPRYVTLAAQIPVAAALVWGRFGGRRLRRLVPMIVFSGALMLLWPNSEIGVEEAEARKADSDLVIADLRAGVPPYALAARHTGYLHSSHNDLAVGLPLLVKSGVGVFAGSRPNPAFREVEVGAPEGLSLATWDEKTRTIESTSVDPWALFRLRGRAFVAGIRIRYDLENGPSTSARFKLQWKRDDQDGFRESQQYQQWTLPVGSDREMFIWIAEPIDAFRLQPDNQRSRFRIESITLLLPETAGPS